PGNNSSLRATNQLSEVSIPASSGYQQHLGGPTRQPIHRMPERQPPLTPRPKHLDRYSKRFGQFAERSPLGPAAALQQHRDGRRPNADPLSQFSLGKLSFRHQPRK